jgi:hypothetical protein
MQRRASRLIGRTSLAISLALLGGILPSFFFDLRARCTRIQWEANGRVALGCVSARFECGPGTAAAIAEADSEVGANTWRIACYHWGLSTWDPAVQRIAIRRAVLPELRFSSNYFPPGLPSNTIWQGSLFIPLWLLAAIAALPWAIPGFLARWRYQSPGHCQKCGYDLSMTPNRCPECGAMPPASSNEEINHA